MNSIYEFKCQFISVGEYSGTSITEPRQIIDYMAGAFEGRRDQEQMWVVCLDGQNQPILRHLLTLGLANQAQIHPREAFRAAIAANAVSVIFLHNHPSGCKRASPEDISITKVLVEAGKIIGIPVLDHLIVAVGSGWASIKATNPTLF